MLGTFCQERSEGMELSTQTSGEGLVGGALGVVWVLDL